MILVKIGGVVATDQSILKTLLQELAAHRERPTVLVHGGGKEVTTVSEKFGLHAEFREGVRLTSTAEMEVVDMVLGGRINIDLVRQARTQGLNAVGLGGQDGGLFIGEARSFSGSQANRTGRITAVNTALLEQLTQMGYFPVVHSTSCDGAGQGLNINADEAAQELAIGARVEALVFISDIAGVLEGGSVLPRLDAAAIETRIASGVIAGGMVPKVRSALQAVSAGVGRVIIGGYRQLGDLQLLLAGSSGTTIE